MSLQSGKHIVKEIGETRCTIVETGASKERVDFLKDLLEFNKYEVLTAEDKKKNEEDPTTYTIGVTDIVFNPVIAVYQRHLYTRDGRKINADYWNQKTTEIKPDYWNNQGR